MGAWNNMVNVLVVLVAAFFTYIGLAFLIMPITSSAPGIEGGPSWDKGSLGAIFLLAAAPMFYYVFSKNARGLPPVRKKARQG